MHHTRPDEADYFRVRHHQRQRARIVGRLLAQGAVSVAVLASGWWGMAALGAHTLASEDGPSAAVRPPVYVAGCPVDVTGLAEDSPEGDPREGCSDEGLSSLISSRRPGAGLCEHTRRTER